MIPIYEQLEFKYMNNFLACKKSQLSFSTFSFIFLFGGLVSSLICTLKDTL